MVFCIEIDKVELRVSTSLSKRKSYDNQLFTREKLLAVLQAFARLVKLNQYTSAQAIRETTEPIAAIYRSFVLKSGKETYELVLNRSVYIVTKGSAFHFNGNRKDLL